MLASGPRACIAASPVSSDTVSGRSCQSYQLRLVTAPEVTASVERHLNVERPVALSKAALEVLAIIAYRQPIARSGIELIRGSASDSAIATLLERGLIAYNPHHLFVTTQAFLSFVGLRDLSELPKLGPD